MVNAGLTGFSVMVHSTSDPSANDLGIVTFFSVVSRCILISMGPVLYILYI